MKKRLYAIELAIIIGFLFSVVICSFSGFAEESNQISSKVLRLHILANSDSEEDQNLKMTVRNEILKQTGPLFEHESNLSAAEKDVSEHLNEIQAIAQNIVAQEGYSYPVNVSLTNMLFNTRTYDDITLPAGRYDALRISIGEGKGHNWWCVLYPPLCVSGATTNLDQTLNQEQINLVKSNPKYDIRFAAIEIFENIKRYFSK